MIVETASASETLPSSWMDLSWDGEIFPWKAISCPLPPLV